MSKVAKRGEISPFLIMEALREANEHHAEHGGDMIHLSLGQPGKGVPRAAAEFASKMALEDRLPYTEAAGIKELRQRIALYYQENYGETVPYERIFITVGSSSAFFLSLLAAFDVGDRIALVQPCYPAYRNILEAMSLEPVLLRGTFENNFQPSVEMLEALDEPVQGIIIASPSNPTGTMITDDELTRLYDYCKAKNIRILSDEIYHNVTYTGNKGKTSLSLGDDTIVLNSFSKYFLMAGWRLGWVVSPPDLVRSYESLVQSFFVSPPALQQYAALKVFDCRDELDATVQEYAENREILLRELPKAGFTKLCPIEGAFYVYANVSNLTNDSAAFCRSMMKETGVVAVSGHDFDKEEGDSYIRMSFSATKSEIVDAVQRLQKWLSKSAA